ncbi:MAG: hypothetical protein ACI4UU_04790 [Clostridia bacterium]
MQNRKSIYLDIKSISKKHTSVTELIIELGNKNIVYAKAHDEV